MSGFYDHYKGHTTLTYMPHSTVRPVEHRLEGLTTGDITYALAALARRVENTPAAESAAQALGEARGWYEADIADRIDLAVQRGLGRWRRWLPGRIQRRITARLMLPLGRHTVDLTAELGAMQARLAEVMTADAAGIPASPAANARRTRLTPKETV